MSKIITKGKGYKISYIRYGGKRIKIIRQATQGELK